MPNKYKNKVEYFGETLIDISDTTAEAEDVVEGKKFYDRSGAPQTGSASIPSKTSDLINDSGFITLKDIPVQKETDPTVPAWAKRSTKPKYTAEEVGALPNDTYIPAKTSDLTNDSGFVTSEDIPKKTSDLTNDSGFITGYTETDPTVPTWAKQSTKPSYTAQEVGALPDDTYIPTKTSDLTNDSGFITREDLPSDTGVVSVNGKAGIVVLDADDVGALPDTTVIPTKTSDLTNDSGFITGYTETDPTVPNWAKQPNKPSYTAAEVGALPDNTYIPNKTSDLTNDSGFITTGDIPAETDPTVPNWAKQPSKPSYTAAEVGALPDNTYIPNKTSDLTNDSGFITGYTETDPTVPSWAKAASKPTYTAAEVGALPDTTAIPTATSDLTNDSGFITSSDIPVISVNNKTGAVSLTASDIGALPSTAGVVKYDEALSLTDNEKSQARANIQAGASNRNLLDNPWFTVNQRNVSGTITSGYIADRWKIAYGSGGVQASRTDNSVTVKSTSGSSHGDIVQRMEKILFDFLVGKTVTASVMRSDGSVISKSFTFQSDGNSIYVGTDLDGNVISVRVYQASTYQDVRFWKWKTAGTFRAVKLELGSYSTLANDVPPDYGEELRKCQRYFIRIKGDPIGSGYVTGGLNQAYIHIPTPVPMRTAPTASIYGSMNIRGTSTTWNVSTVSVPTDTQPTNGVAVIAAVNASQAMAVGAYMSSANSYIDLSADL